MRSIAIILLLLFFGGTAQAAESDWQLAWWTIDSGGEIEAEGGSWTLSGTIGQWDANTTTVLTGGDWDLSGGFWQSEKLQGEETDRIFSDRFEG